MKHVLVVILLMLSSCATGASTYEYRHLADGSTEVKIKSANEIEGGMEMGINRDTGTLDVKIGNMTKKSEVETVVSGLDSIIGNVTKLANPIPGG